MYGILDSHEQLIEKIKMIEKQKEFDNFQKEELYWNYLAKGKNDKDGLIRTISTTLKHKKIEKLTRKEAEYFEKIEEYGFDLKRKGLGGAFAASQYNRYKKKVDSIVRKKENIKNQLDFNNQDLLKHEEHIKILDDSTSKDHTIYFSDSKTETHQLLSNTESKEISKQKSTKQVTEEIETLIYCLLPKPIQKQIEKENDEKSLPNNGEKPKDLYKAILEINWETIMDKETLKQVRELMLNLAYISEEYDSKKDKSKEDYNELCQMAENVLSEINSFRENIEKNNKAKGYSKQKSSCMPIRLVG